MSKIYVGDIGTELIVDTGSDLTEATDVSLKIKKPSGSLVEWTGSVFETTKIKYVLQGGDTADQGVYKGQAHVVFDSGWSGLGETFTFNISGIFE